MTYKHKYIIEEGNPEVIYYLGDLPFRCKTTTIYYPPTKILTINGTEYEMPQFKVIVTKEGVVLL